MRFLLAPLLLLSLTGCKAIFGADRTEAEAHAEEFIQRNIPDQKVQNLECQGADTDDNGYVSCTVSLRNPSGAVQLVALECAATWFYEVRWTITGCRVPKVGQ